MTDLRSARERVLMVVPAGTVFAVSCSAWSTGPVAWEIFLAAPLGQRSKWYRGETFDAALRKLAADAARWAA